MTSIVLTWTIIIILISIYYPIYVLMDPLVEDIFDEANRMATDGGYLSKVSTGLNFVENAWDNSWIFLVIGLLAWGFWSVAKREYGTQEVQYTY